MNDAIETLVIPAWHVEHPCMNTMVASGSIGGARVREVVGGVTIVYDGDLIDALYPEYKDNFIGMYDAGITYEMRGEKVREWCAKHGAAFYSAEKYEFSLFAAARKARAEGKSIVVVENLS